MADEQDMVRKVQALWARADHPNTPDAEREACIKKARDLMAKHAIDEMVLAEAKGVEEEVILADILLYEIADNDPLVPDQRIKLAHYIGEHNRCKGIITQKMASIREDGTKQLAGKYYVIVGYRSDVELTRLMYQALGVQMITDMMMEDTSHMSKADRINFWINFCDAFADRIERRIAEVDREVENIVMHDDRLMPVLRDRRAAVQDMVDRMFPNLRRSRTKRFTFDPNARARGKKAADRATLGKSQGVGGSKRELKK